MNKKNKRIDGTDEVLEKYTEDESYKRYKYRCYRDLILKSLLGFVLGFICSVFLKVFLILYA